MSETCPQASLSRFTHHSSWQIPMFPLAGKEFPSTSDELCRSIQDALEEVLEFPGKNGSAVNLEGSFPKIRKLKIDLSGARINVTEPPPQPKPKGKRTPGITLDKLDIA